MTIDELKCIIREVITEAMDAGRRHLNRDRQKERGA